MVWTLSAVAAAPLLALALFLPNAVPLPSVRIQCGGTGWTGSPTCIRGSVCTYVSAQFSACIGEQDKPNYWFSFGDSYTETGFNALGTLPTIGNPLGNPPYPGRTAVGGENWIDFSTTAYNKSLVLTYNFAWGGATIDSSLVKSGQGISLTDEVNTFLKKFANKPPSTPWNAQNALFSVWIGINDIGYSYDLGGDRDAFSDKLLDAYFALVEELYEAGARNYLFINVPPMERSPYFLTLPVLNQTTEKAVIDGYNRKLQTRIDLFEENHDDVRLWTWDAHRTFNIILDNPTAFGFKDATSYDSKSDSSFKPEYFWRGNYHPSPAAHKYFAKAVRDVLWDGAW